MPRPNESRRRPPKRKDAATRVRDAHDDEGRLRLVQEAPHGGLARLDPRGRRRHGHDDGPRDGRPREQRAGDLQFGVLRVLRAVHAAAEVGPGIQHGPHPGRHRGLLLAGYWREEEQGFEEVGHRLVVFLARRWLQRRTLSPSYPLVAVQPCRWRALAIAEKFLLGAGFLLFFALVHIPVFSCQP